MNELQKFRSEEFGEIRTVEIENAPWFVGKDIANILGYTNPNKAIQDHVDEEDKLNNESLSSLGQRGGWLINESGLYSLVLKSNLPTAKPFKRWVTSEVLPAIRKHGGYLTQQKIEEALLNPDTLIELATTLKEERTKRLVAEQRVMELQPKADYTDTILKNKGLVTITQIAKDYGMSGSALNKILHELRIQYKQGNQWLLYRDIQDKGYTHSETIAFKRSDGRDDVSMITKWTQKGRLFLYEILKDNGILPVIEQR